MNQQTPAGLVFQRKQIRKGAVELADNWIRSRTSRQVDIDRELWIALIKDFETILMRNRPHLRDIDIGTNYPEFRSLPQELE